MLLEDEVSKRVEHRVIEEVECRRCSHCREWKPLAKFSHNRCEWDKLQHQCKACDTAHRAANKEKIAAYNHKYCVKNKEKIAAHDRKRYIENKEKVAARSRKYLYGITPEEYNTILKAQGGVCAICGRADDNGGALSVDHDHETGKTRGLLCKGCNLLLGKAHDDPELLRKAAAYLEREQ